MTLVKNMASKDERVWERVKKLVVYTLFFMSLLCISREDNTKLVLFMRNKFSFLYVYIQFDVPKCKFILKNSSSKYRLFRRILASDTKITLGYNFGAPLTHYSPVLLTYTPWKYQKIFRSSDVFRGCRKATPGCNGLII